MIRSSLSFAFECHNFLFYPRDSAVSVLNAIDAGSQFGNLELISRWHMGVQKVKNTKNYKLGGLTEAFNKKTKYEITQEVDKGYFFLFGQGGTKCLACHAYCLSYLPATSSKRR